MYIYDLINEEKKNNLVFILSNKGLFPFVKDDVLFIRFKDKNIFQKNVGDFCINDLSDILEISIVDSTYLYYFLDVARENGDSMKSYSKKKSLRL